MRLSLALYLDKLFYFIKCYNVVVVFPLDGSTFKGGEVMTLIFVLVIAPILNRWLNILFDYWFEQYKNKKTADNPIQRTPSLGQ